MENELPKRAIERGRPLSTGELSGDDMRIEWRIWDPADDLLGMMPITIKVTFETAGQSFEVTGEFGMDPIVFERRVKSMEAWNRYLVQMARMTVMSAKRASELQ